MAQNKLDISGLPDWAWNLQKELSRTKEVTDSLFLAVNDQVLFDNLVKKLINTSKNIEFDERLIQLLTPELNSLSLAEYIIFSQYHSAVVYRYHFFDELNLVTIPNDSGITVAVAGGLSGLLPILVVNGQDKSFETGSFGHIYSNELRNGENRIRVTFPTHDGDTSFFATIKK